MKIQILISLTIMIFSVSIYGQRNPAQTDVDSMCNVTAYINDEDPKGLNVRSKPNSKSKKIGKIPYEMEGTMVDIIGYKGNWAKIETARVASGSVFSKTGWVYMPLLSVNARPPVENGAFVRAFSTPNLEDKIFTNVKSYSTYQLVGCFEDWVKIKIPKKMLNKSKANKGWIHSDMLCGDVWMGCQASNSIK